MVAEQVGKRVFSTLDEVKDRFDEVIARVENGESFAIMREGRVVAELSPESKPPFEREAAEQTQADFRKERATWPKVNITRAEILAWRHEGHRV